MPQKSQPQVGRIYPVKANYNKIVYVTLLEKKKLEQREVVFWISFIIFALFTIGKHFYKMKSSKSEWPA